MRTLKDGNSINIVFKESAITFETSNMRKEGHFISIEEFHCQLYLP